MQKIYNENSVLILFHILFLFFPYRMKKKIMTKNFFYFSIKNVVVDLAPI
jgi:hypothetical protein